MKISFENHFNNELIMFKSIFTRRDKTVLIRHLLSNLTRFYFRHNLQC